MHKSRLDPNQTRVTLANIRKEDSRLRGKTQDSLDCSVSRNFSPRRKTTAITNFSKLSSVSSHLSTTNLNLRKLETENYNLELDLNYNDNLLSIAEDCLAEKTFKQKEKSYEKLLKTIHEQTKLVQDKFNVMHSRLIDTQILNNATVTVEANIDEIKHFQENFVKYNMENIIKNLRKLLDRFNSLRCINIELPETQEDFQKLHETLMEIQNTLGNINDSNYCETLESVRKEYDAFKSGFQEILISRKLLDEKLNDLQIEVLKSCSNLLANIDL